ncbi:MAG: glycoside hydrolase family 16 protein [Candidatus Marinimicrobia bacterium]|nr:glycoside hydrolase family 16 protein [Candidatus Neomarinimicrobiota bacterium]
MRLNMHYKKLLNSLLILLIFIKCGPTSSNDTENKSKAWDLKEWKLVWHDEFDSDSLNTQLWKYETGGHGWGNNEEQYYTERRENAYLKDGNLIICARKENYEDSDYTSARLNSRQGWTYGRFDVKAKLPQGRGTWPAIWMLPDEWTVGTGNWPGVGEIDIMEHVGYDPGQVHASIHTEAYNHVKGTQKTAQIFDTTVFSQFHVYSLEWNQSSIQVSMDDSLYFTYQKEADADWKTWPFTQDFHLLLNLAIGGAWGGAQGIDNSIFPAKFVIDYVRVYKKIK